MIKKFWRPQKNKKQKKHATEEKEKHKKSQTETRKCPQYVK
jgi:hypothetical protein